MKTKNAIVGLTRGYQDIKRYDLLIRRNQSIYNKIYTNLTNDFDVILFHEGNITKEQQTHIQNQTPNLPLIFINIKEVEPKSAFNDSLNIINRETNAYLNNIDFSFDYNFSFFHDDTSDYKFIIYHKQSY